MALKTAARRLSRKQTVEARQQIPARLREALPNGRLRTIDQLQQFAAAQRADQVDFLPRERAVEIERAGIEEIARRSRLHKRLHSITRAQVLGKAGRARPAIPIHAQPAADRPVFVCHFHALEIDFVTKPPGKRDGVLAQAPLPTQRLAGVQLVRGDEPGHMIRRHLGPFDVRRQRAEGNPRDRSECERRNRALSPGKHRPDQEGCDSRREPQAYSAGPLTCEQDASRERGDDPYNRYFHERRRSRTTTSM
jgi:hypothetical protein